MVFGFTNTPTLFRELKFPYQVATLDKVSNNIFTVVTFTGKAG